ncbi:hypothetical protein B4135_4159 [Caldibacillus debilis]|uniref:Uncharacterized protein n=1 Tax=Caldibacillus debilis TaxID=301148 RepID=A0A150L6Q1_9BACI|nr:hypothetical protein B4135_4159 [Caldibacillus debilis]
MAISFLTDISFPSEKSMFRSPGAWGFSFHSRDKDVFLLILYYNRG